MTREDAIAKIASQLVEGGWSSIYSFVEDHVDEDDLNYDEEEEDEDD